MIPIAEVGDHGITPSTNLGNPGCYEWEMGYDLTGQVDSVTYPDATGRVSPASEVLEYDFDAFGRVRRAYSGLGVYLDEGLYDASDRPAQMTLGNGVVETTRHDPLRDWFRTRDIAVVQGDGLALSYDYDPAGRPKQHTWSDPAVHILDFHYDTLDRLDGITGELQQTFFYDALGRITSNSWIGTYTHGAAPLHGVSAAGRYSLGYDASGNAKRIDAFTYEWNEEGRLVRAITPQGGIALGYTAAGRRAYKSTVSGTTMYFEDLVEEEPTGRRLFYKVGQRKIAMRSANGVEWQHADLLGL